MRQAIHRLNEICYLIGAKIDLPMHLDSFFGCAYACCLLGRACRQTSTQMKLDNSLVTQAIKINTSNANYISMYAHMCRTFSKSSMK